MFTAVRKINCIQALCIMGRGFIKKGGKIEAPSDVLI